MWKVKKSKSLKSQMGLQLWKNMDEDDVEIIRKWERFRKNMKASATETVGYYELKHEPWFDEE
jgi:hypothetical protein